MYQLWSLSSEYCPEETIPIRRNFEQDCFTDHNIIFGNIIIFVFNIQEQKPSINVWNPEVTDGFEFSLSQMWVNSGSFCDNLNTIETGWYVYFFNSYIHVPSYD
ncbi:putative neprosin [Helianthus annuus]|nr:putative neprosin [Helianthus annuus]KAJ0573934.1 putative neprosin [Helianthus annuus]KAJ0738269.1 putative neprosin [Helianthus annuus]